MSGIVENYTTLVVLEAKEADACVYPRDHFYITSAHFWTFLTHPNSALLSTERQQKLQFLQAHQPSPFADVIQG